MNIEFSLIETSIRAVQSGSAVFLSFVVISLLIYAALQTPSFAQIPSDLKEEGAARGGIWTQGGVWLGVLGLIVTGVLELRGSVGRPAGGAFHYTDAQSPNSAYAEMGQSISELGAENWGTGFHVTVGAIVIGAALLVLILGVVQQNNRSRLGRYTHTSKPEAFVVLVLLATLGMLLLISAKDLIVLYLSIELISLSLYVMAASGIMAGATNAAYSTEAGLRYFILGALSSGVLLFGCAVVYVITGHTGYAEIANFAVQGGEVSYFSAGAHAGTPANFVENSGLGSSAHGLSGPAIFILIAILFKLAAAPFHMWAPDVYEGSPTIVTAFFAAVPKVAIFSALVTLVFGPFYGVFTTTVQPLLLLSAVLSVIVGSIGALNQTRIKRLLAYSAIGHMGFMLLGLATGTVSSLHGAIVYFILYIIMTVNTFAFVLSNQAVDAGPNKGPAHRAENAGLSNNPAPLSSGFSSQTRGTLSKNEGLQITELSGLSRTQPVLAISFALTLLSLAGIPPLAGFLSKFLVLNQAVANGWFFVALTVILFSVVGCYYYVRIIQLMFFKSSSSDPRARDFKDLSAVATQSSAAPAVSFNNTSGSAIVHDGSHGPTAQSSLLLGATFFIILTALIYPNPIITAATDALMCTLIP